MRNILYTKLVLFIMITCAGPLKINQGCHGQEKVRGKQTFFKVREKSGNFFKKSGKIFGIGKVSEQSRNSVFRFIANKFSARFFNTGFCKRLSECCIARKPINLTLYA